MNPTTGQILDADIIFDADFIRFWKDEYENFSPEAVAAMTGGALDIERLSSADQGPAPRAPIGRHVPLRAAQGDDPRGPWLAAFAATNGTASKEMQRI